jgi:hypothetical protein
MMSFLVQNAKDYKEDTLILVGRRRVANRIAKGRFKL